MNPQELEHLREESPKVRITERRLFWGPSPYAPEQAVLCALQMQAQADRLDRAVQLMRQAFEDWLPEAMPETTASRRAALAVASWAWAALNEVRGCVQAHGLVSLPAAAAGAGDAEPLWVYVGFHKPDITTHALNLGVEVLSLALDGADRADAAQWLRAAVDGPVRELLNTCRWQHPDFQACILMRAARSADIPVLPFSAAARVWQYGWGHRSRVFFETACNGDGLVGYMVSRDKSLSKDALRALGVATPAHVLVGDESQLEAAVQRIGWPCVVKPLDQGGGRGVTAGIRAFDELLQAYRWARSHTSEQSVMVEAFCEGVDHRLFVVDGELVAAVVREHAQVIGDGVHTVRQLIDALNAGRSLNKIRSCYKVPIVIDPLVESHLGSQGYLLGQVVPAGHVLTLRSNANVSTGGLAHDVTDRVHPEIKAMSRRIAKALGMHTAGFDLMTADISISPIEGDARMIEINHTPGLDVLIAAGHDANSLGLKVLGPDLGRLPTELRVVEPHSLAAERAALQQSRCTSGDAWVLGNEVCVGGLSRWVSGGEPWAGVLQALQDPATERLAVVCTADDLYRWGLPLDRVDSVWLGIRSMEEAWLAMLQSYGGLHATENR